MISQAGINIRRLAVIAMLASGAAACSSNQPVAPEPTYRKATVVTPRPAADLGKQAASVALKQVGVPYTYGGSTPRGFDCSGLVHYSYANVGKSLPRTTAGLWNEIAPVESSRMRVGDLLFFNIAGKMSHVGMYVGSGRFVHAPSSGKAVSVEHLGSDYYRNAFIRAGRPR